MSKLIVDSISNSDERDFALVHTWINFNAAGGGTIRDSLNVSSITDNGVGDFTIFFSMGLDNTNYCALGTGNKNITGNFGRIISIPHNQAPTVSSIRLQTSNSSGTADDWEYTHVQITGGIN